ncbi:ABC transporter substrate-binding protein [Ammoniphilus sp. 3BR4]|uniref:ABC transporter substrate-binding protein n=1 Tax=Ammoniphilus sp. 3BR4 TaxID=3158265 RepID=UPI003466576D
MKKRVLNLCVSALLFAGLVGCGTAKETEGEVAAPKEQAASSDQPVEIRYGGGFSTEENLWLMELDPSLTPNQGKTYSLKMTQFRANADRLNAYQAGQIDAGSIGQGAAMITASQGIPIKVVASVAKETPGKGFNAQFLALKESNIASVNDLKGKTIGIPDFKSPTDMWARAAVRSAGLDPDKDVKYAIIPIPSMTEAVKSKKIDAGMFPSEFAAKAEKSGEFVQVFTSKTGVDVDEDFYVMFMNPEFVEKNQQAVKDFLADYAAATKYYIEHQQEVKKLLVEKGKVKADPEFYVDAPDFNRSETASLNKEGWKQIQDILLKDKWLEAPVDLEKLLDTSLLPNP